MKHWLRNIALGSATLATLAATPAAFAATSHAPKAYTAKHVEGSAKHAKKATVNAAKTARPEEEKKADVNHKNVVSGKITAIAADIITLQDARGTTFTINTSATTAVKVDGTASTLSKLVVGDKIHVKGQTSLAAVDTITADSIMKGEIPKPTHTSTKRMNKSKTAGTEKEGK